MQEEIAGSTGIKLKELLGDLPPFKDWADDNWSILGNELKANGSTAAIFSGAIRQFVEAHVNGAKFPMTTEAWKVYFKKLAKGKYDADKLLEIFQRANLIDQITLPAKDIVTGKVLATKKEKEVAKEANPNTNMIVWYYSPEFKNGAGKLFKKLANVKMETNQVANKLDEKLSKDKINKFIAFVKNQINLDVTPYIDFKNSIRDFITVDTNQISSEMKRKLFTLEKAYDGKYFKIADQGGLGHAFHILSGFDKVETNQVKEASNLEKKLEGLVLSFIGNAATGEHQVNKSRVTPNIIDLVTKIKKKNPNYIESLKQRIPKLMKAVGATDNDIQKELDKIMETVQSEAKGKLIGADSSLEGLKKGISKYFYGSTVTLTPIGKDEWSVSTGKGPIDWARVILKGGRYRFERKPDMETKTTEAISLKDKHWFLSPEISKKYKTDITNWGIYLYVGKKKYGPFKEIDDVILKAKELEKGESCGEPGMEPEIKEANININTPLQLLKHPFKSYTGVTWPKEHVDAYNKEVEKINKFIEAGKPVPENILNGAHNLFTQFSDPSLKSEQVTKQDKEIDLKIKGISGLLKELGFDTASKDVNADNINTYAQWVAHEFKSKIKTTDPITRKVFINDKIAEIYKQAVLHLKKLGFDIKESSKVTEAQPKQAVWSKKFKTLTYFDSRNTSKTIACDSLERAKKIIELSKVDQELVTEEVKLSEGKHTQIVKIPITDKNKERIQKLMGGAKNNVISGKTKDAAYQAYITGVKKDNLGIFNVEITSYVDSDIMNKKYKNEILTKVLGLSETSNVQTEEKIFKTPAEIVKNNSIGKNGIDLALAKPMTGKPIAITPNSKLSGFKNIQDLKVGEKVVVLYKDTARGPEATEVRSVKYEIRMQMGMKESKTNHAKRIQNVKKLLEGIDGYKKEAVAPDPVRLLVQTIMGMVASIEKKENEMFQRSHPDLEKEMWIAIDSKDKGKLRGLIKKLDELT